MYLVWIRLGKYVTEVKRLANGLRTKCRTVEMQVRIDFAVDGGQGECRLDT